MRLFPLALLCLACAASADTAVLPPVSTELKRDSNALPYGRINELLTRLKQHGEGLFRVDFTVDKDKTKVALAGIRMVVRSDEADYPIRIADDGTMELPLLPLAEARNADVATNVAKGQLAVRGTLELTTPPEQLDLAKVRQVMRVARTLREELLPFYLRWLFPRMQGVRICSDTPTWELTWRENGQLLGLPLAAASEREPDTKKGAASRPCTLLTGQENWPEAARLLPPPGTRLSIKF